MRDTFHTLTFPIQRRFRDVRRILRIIVITVLKLFETLFLRLGIHRLFVCLSVLVERDRHLVPMFGVYFQVFAKVLGTLERASLDRESIRLTLLNEHSPAMHSHYTPQTDTVADAQP